MNSRYVLLWARIRRGWDDSCLRRGAWLAAVGLVLGAIVIEQLLLAFGSLPIGGRPDAVIYVAVATLLLVLALAACLVPAIRVASIDPVTALRQQ